MCRTAGRRCEHNWSEAQHQADLARRRILYHAKKAGAAAPTQRVDTPTENIAVTDSLQGDLTPAQSAFFEASSIRDPEGQLVKVYHGSSVEFDAFDTGMLGKGNDSWGPGFYFTDVKETAESYTQSSDSPEANVKEFYLNMSNPIIIDGREEAGMGGVTFSKEVIQKVLEDHPNVNLQPGEEDDEGNTNFLEDYASDFWDKDEHSPQEIKKMISDVADSFTGSAFTYLDSLFGRDHASALTASLRKHSGHDGVIVDFGEDTGKHYISWGSDQMKLTSNSNPAPDSDKF